MQIAQCLVVHRARRLGHDIRRVFGKAMTSRIDCAPVISMTRRSRPKARPPCGRTELQRIEQEAELLFLLGLVDAENAEYRLLHFLAMDADGAATQLGTVEHHMHATAQAGLASSSCGVHFGAVNGWCSALSEPSSFSSNIGKSTTHSGAQSQVSSLRSWPSLRSAPTPRRRSAPAPKKNNIAIDRADAVEDRPRLSSGMNLTIGDCCSLDALGAR